MFAKSIILAEQNFVLNNRPFSKIFTDGASQWFTSFILIFIFLVPWFLASFYSWPETDNYAYSSGMRDLDFLASCKQIYVEWSGRYSANAIISAGLKYMGETPEKYSLVILFLISSCFLLFYLSFRFLFYQYTLVLAILLTVWLFALLPDTAEGLFWLMGIGTYTIGAAFLFLFAGVWSRFQDKHFLLMVLLSGLIILINGFNEAIWIALAFLIVLFLFSYFWEKKLLPPNFIVIALAAAFIVSIVLSAFAPGNFVRASVSDVHQNFGFTEISQNLGVAFTHFKKMFYAIVHHPLFVYGSLFFLIIFTQQTKNAYTGQKMLAMFLAAFFCLFFQVLFLASIKPMIGFSGRMEVLLFLSFMLFWILGLNELSAHPYLQRQLKSISEKKKLIGFVLLLLLFIVPRSNYFLCLKTLISGDAKTYYESSKLRHETITSSNYDTLLLAPLARKPRLLHTLDLSEDFGAWQNKAYEAWYRKALAVPSKDKEN
ncbi:MAG: DUF6056 family protein [Flavobacteriales bacterium]